MKSVRWFVPLAAALLLAGCEQQKKVEPTTRSEDSYTSLDSMDGSRGASRTPASYEPPPRTAAQPANPPAGGEVAMPADSMMPPVDHRSPPPAHGTARKADQPLKPSSKSKEGASKAGASTASTGQTYVVQKGDTLEGIAKKVYGDKNKWKKIWEANKKRVPAPAKLQVGTKLIIP